MSYSTLQVRFQDSICQVRIDRPAANNTIDDRLVAEFADVLAECEQSATVVVLSGSPEIFCMGADFAAMAAASASGGQSAGPGPLYDVWLKLATGPFVSIAQVRGKANAGGIGFVAACDIVLADETAQFSLSELLFGVYPACVLPFLIRRVGFQKAHYLTLMTHPVPVQRAHEWGLVDAFEASSDSLLRRHLLRLRRLGKPALRRYKTYMNQIHQPLAALKSQAVSGNLEVFSDQRNLQAIARYVQQGVLPWES